MIFSKQLGSLGGRTAQDDIRYMANHIRRIQEELEYRLAHLDSQNITEIDMGQTKIYSGNVELLTMIKSGEQFSAIEQSIKDITATVADLKTGKSNTLQLSADRLSLVDGNGNAVSIKGGWIEAEGLVASSLMGETITLNSSTSNREFYFTPTYRKLLLSGTANSDIEIYGNIKLVLRGGTVGALAPAEITLSSDEESASVRVSGDLYPKSDDMYSLGTDKKMWAEVWAATGEVSYSDRNKKNSIEDLPDKYVVMFDSLVPRRFKMNKGTSDRYHVGFIAQEVEEAMTAVGIASQEFGGFVKGANDEGEPVYALRYSEFIGILVAKIQQMQREIDTMKARIA